MGSSRRKKATANNATSTAPQSAEASAAVETSTSSENQNRKSQDEEFATSSRQQQQRQRHVDDDGEEEMSRSSGPLGLSIDADEDSDDSLTRPPLRGGPASLMAQPSSSIRPDQSIEDATKQQAPNTSSRPPPPPPPDTAYQRQLEERVEQLELKLATLSRLLQTATARGSSATSCSPLRRRSPVSATPERSLSPPLVVAANNHDSNSSIIKNNNSSDGDAMTPVQSQRRRASASRQMSARSPHLESPAPHASADRGGGIVDVLQRREVMVVPDSPPFLLNDGAAFELAAAEDPGSKVHNANKTDIGGTTEPETTATTAATSDEEKAALLTQQKRNRNLSLMLLFEGNEEEYKKHSNATNSEAMHSMTPAERQWLRPKLQQQQQQQQQQSSDPQKHNSQEPLLYEHESDIQQPLLPVEEKDQKAALLRRSSSVAFDPQTTSGNNSAAKTTRTTAGDGSKGDASEMTGDTNATAPNGADPLETSTERRKRSSSITKDLLKKKLQTKWLDYLNSVQETTPDVDVQMEEFIKVPPALEGILAFGLLICLDSFLYMFTVLPIRFVWSCLLLVIKILHWRRKRQPREHFQFHRRHLYQIIQCLIVSLVFRYVLMPISIGKLYHWIRGQSMIKLYVIIAMVEIFDRLFSSLGQDCLDSMYWNSITRPGSSRFLVSVVVVLVYAAIHTLILFVHVATLNVAMNSHDQALLSLLIGGNFAEIKSTVFKKFNKAALFKITASDICERFKLMLFLSLVLLLNVSQGMNQQQLFGYARICGIVWCAELLADWIKHAFITKFNFLPARVYPEYALLLAGDVTGIGHEGVSLDHSHAVVKRIGFAQIPLLCVMFRLVNEATKKFLRSQEALSASNNLCLFVIQSFFAVNGVTASLLLWVFLLVLKLSLGLLLQRLSFGKLYAAPEYSQLTPLLTKSNKAKKTQ